MSKTLIEQALQAAENAYAPYSRFRVGAAVLSADGTATTGNNQENASYGLTICAERVALAKYFSEHPDGKVVRLAVGSLDTEGGAVRPCGACLQAIREAALRSGIDIEVEMADKSVPISQLLPDPF